LAVSAAVSPAGAQQGFDVWTADNGLPQNILRDVCQTPDGYLWVATLDGLARFDGVRFTVYNKANSPGIESNRFTRLYEDPHGDLWLATEASGVTRYHAGRFTTYTIRDGLPHNHIRSVTGDESGSVWILSGDSIAQWDERSGRFRDVTPRALHYDMFRWERGGFWGWDRTRLYCFVNGNLTSYELPPWLRGRVFNAAAEDPSGAIWLETTGRSLARIVDGNFERAPPASFLFTDRIGNQWPVGIGYDLTRHMTYRAAGHDDRIIFIAMREDREGNLWLATEGQGLYRAPRRFVTVYSKDEGLIDRIVYPILQDHQGDIWIGAWPGGFSRWHNGTFTSYTTKDGLAKGVPTALGEDREGRLWAATAGGLRVFRGGRFRPDGPTLPSGASVQAIYQDRAGALWFGSSHGLARYQNGISKIFSVADGLATEDVRAMAEGPAGDLWIGGYGGVTRLRGGEFTRWTERDGLPSNAVREIHIDADGVGWIGTYDGGLGRFQNGRFTRYTTREGLFNNGVFRILEDARGNFWMSSNRGIYRVSKRELNEFAAGARSAIASVSYGRNDGMRNEECNGGAQPAGTQARDGKLWFPTQDGVAVIDPQTVPANPQPPPVMIESVLIDRSPAPVDRPVRIAPDKTDLEIQYTALSFIESGQIRFRYRLKRLDSGWTEAGARRIAYYSHVPPGDYTFTVIARNRDGVWNNEGKSLRVTVLAPFYRTWWFEALECSCALLLVAAAWRYRVMQFERERAIQQAFARQLIASQENERKRIAVELHDSLAQHLVVIKNLALFYLRAQGKPDGGAGGLDQIEEISAEASLAIDETREISYNLRPFQLDRLGLTKAVQAMARTASTASGIKITSELANVDDAFAEDLRINFYRIVQECLNNIAKHSAATEASIAVERTAERVVLAIHDNGRGFTPGAGSSDGGAGGFGLTGIAERARLLDGELAIQSTPGRGTTVRVEFQLRRKAHA